MHAGETQPMDEDHPDPVPPPTVTQKSATDKGPKAQLVNGGPDKPVASTSTTPEHKVAEGNSSKTSSIVGKAVTARIKVKRGKATEESHSDQPPSATAPSQEKAVNQARPPPSGEGPEPMEEDVPAASTPKADPRDDTMSTNGTATKPTAKPTAGPSRGNSSAASTTVEKEPAGSSMPSGKGSSSRSVSSGKELMDRVKSKKQTLQGKAIPVLLRAPAVEDEDMGNGSGDHNGEAELEHAEPGIEDGDDEMDLSPDKAKGAHKGKGKGKGKGKDAGADKGDMFLRLEGVIAGAVRQAVAELVPGLGMTITPTHAREKISTIAQKCSSRSRGQETQQGRKERIFGKYWWLI